MMTDGPTGSQSAEEVVRSVEIGHLDIGRADGVGYVRIATRTCCQIVSGGDRCSTSVEAGQ